MELRLLYVAVFRYTYSISEHDFGIVSSPQNNALLALDGHEV